MVGTLTVTYNKLHLLNTLHQLHRTKNSRVCVAMIHWHVALGRAEKGGCNAPPAMLQKMARNAAMRNARDGCWNLLSKRPTTRFLHTFLELGFAQQDYHFLFAETRTLQVFVVG